MRLRERERDRDRDRDRERQTKVHGPKEKFGCFKGKQKGSKIREAMPTKIGLHAFPINLYLHEIYEPILFLTPMDYSKYMYMQRTYLHVIQ